MGGFNRGGFAGGRYGYGGYGFRGGYGYRGYGYGGFGFGLGFGWPYYGYGWPYYGYGYGYGYPGYYYDGYNPYDYGYDSSYGYDPYAYNSYGTYDNGYGYAPNGYANNGYSAAPVVINQSLPASNPPSPNSSAQSFYRQPDYYLIAFNDHTIQAAINYHVQGDQIVWTTREHVEKQAPISSVDLRFSEQINRDRHVDFRLQ